MGKIARFIETSRARLYYRQSVYIPGYVYSPWKKWALILALLLIVTAIGGPVVYHRLQSDAAQGIIVPAVDQTSSAQASMAHLDHKQKPRAIQYYTVDRVVDGDTIVVDINGAPEKVRFIGVDTPETVDPRKPVQCYGLQASSYVKRLLTGARVGLESDSSQGDKDRYGRLLRYIFLTDGTNLDEQLIAKGYGHEYTYNLPYKYQSQFRQAEDQAKAKKLGLWASDTCNGNTLQGAY